MPAYDTAAIRTLISAAYSDTDFTIMCYDHFRDAYDRFSEGMLLSLKIQTLIMYAEQRGRLEELLSIIRKQRPEKYEEFGPRLLTPGWLPSRASTGEQRSSKIVAERRPSIQRFTAPPSPSPPLEIRLKVDDIRRHVDALNVYIDLFSQAEDVLNIIPHLQRAIESQRTFCTNYQWEDARKGHEGLTQTCDDLSLPVLRLADRLSAVRVGLRPLIVERAARLSKAQSEFDSLKELLRDECDAMIGFADASAGVSYLQTSRSQIVERLSMLRREVGNLSSAVLAIRKELYDEIRGCVMQLARLVPTDKETGTS